MKDKKYLIGLILIGISFLACVISYWLIPFAIPIFIVGSLITFLSSQTLLTKAATVIVPILLWFPSMVFFLSIYNYTTPKTFLIPSNCEGKIRIVYEEKCGIEPRKENGREILEFPENGILILNQKFDGHVNNSYFLTDKNGKRTEVQHTGGSAGTMGGSGTEKEIVFSDFYIYKKDTAQDDWRSSQKMDSITWAVVRSCRREN